MQSRLRKMITDVNRLHSLRNWPTKGSMIEPSRKDPEVPTPTRVGIAKNPPKAISQYILRFFLATYNGRPSDRQADFTKTRTAPERTRSENSEYL
jgi:hypothetical protein